MLCGQGVQKTFNTHTTHITLGILDKQPNQKPSYRNIRLKIFTYKKLEKFKIRLMSQKGDSKITFNDVINDLLDKAIEREEK